MWFLLTFYILKCISQAASQDDEVHAGGLACAQSIQCPGGPDDPKDDVLSYFNPLTETEFRLYTKSNPIEGQRIYLNDEGSLRNSNFDHRKKTKVIIHGFLNGYLSDTNRKLKKAYLDNYDVNVVVASWGAGSKTLCYNWAVTRTKSVGPVVGQFLDFLIGNDTRAWDDLTILGHSLGAHVAGFAGRSVKLGKVGTIIGLDPAGPNFTFENATGRLQSTDAQYVECIHTNWRCYGFKQPICQSDFYPNGGYEQPGCSAWKFWDLNVCDHSRSVELFAASLYDNSFGSLRCPSKPDLGRNGKALNSYCVNGPEVLMGGEPGNKDLKIHGVFNLETTGSYPYGLSRRDNTLRLGAVAPAINVSKVGHIQAAVRPSSFGIYPPKILSENE